MISNLSRQAKLFLLKTARSSIKAAQDRKEYTPDEAPEGLDFTGGCFVTLNLRSRLRGCIGNFRDDIDIIKNVTDMASQAALHDPRFGPVSKDELGMCEIEISILTPMMKTSASEIKVGRDGIYIIKDSHRGVLLPQVAKDHGWDEETFLSQTCVKAGLNAFAWKEKETDIYRFEALVFSENELD